MPETDHIPERQSPRFTETGSLVAEWDPYAQYILPRELEQRLALERSATGRGNTFVSATNPELQHPGLYSITAGSADTDATAVTAGQVIGHILYL